MSHNKVGTVNTSTTAKIDETDELEIGAIEDQIFHTNAPQERRKISFRGPLTSIEQVFSSDGDEDGDKEEKGTDDESQLSWKQKFVKKYRHPSYVAVYLREGLNIDLEHDYDSNPDKWFHFHLLKSGILNTIGIVVTIMSWITWFDKDFDPVYIGNYFAFLHVPREIIVPTLGNVFVMTSVSLATSWAVYYHNPHLKYLLVLLRNVAETPGAVPDRGMDPEILKELKQKTGTLIMVLRFLVTFPTTKVTSTMVAGFFIPTGVFAYKSWEYFTTWKVALIITWGIIYAFWLDFIIWSVGAAVLVTLIPCNFFILTMRKLKREEAEHRKTRNGDRSMDTKFFYKQLIQMKYLVYFTRRYNPFLRVVIGWVVWYACSAIVVYVFCIFFMDAPVYFKCAMFGYLFLTLPALLMMLIIIAHFPHDFMKRIERLFAAVPMLVGEEPRNKHKLNWILDEMRYENSFDCSIFIKGINYIFIIKVMAEMAAYLLLAVETYVI